VAVVKDGRCGGSGVSERSRAVNESRVTMGLDEPFNCQPVCSCRRSRSNHQDVSDCSLPTNMHGVLLLLEFLSI
jgi:hypothetical protein